jgi:AcrR family transcriptional regulator
MRPTLAEPDASSPRGRAEVERALLDAAERLLVGDGYAAISTRRLADEAGVNHGLVHYYFGSMEELLFEVLDRFTDALIERQVAMYAAPQPFLERWRQAMRYLDEDMESGYQKIWLELQAMSWNHPELRERMADVTMRWRAVLADAFGRGLDELRIDRGDLPVEVAVCLVATFNQGMILERHIGVVDGHAELLAWIDARLPPRKEGDR